MVKFAHDGHMLKHAVKTFIIGKRFITAMSHHEVHAAVDDMRAVFARKHAVSAVHEDVFTSHRKESKAKGEAPHPLSDVHEKPHLAKGKANHKHWKKAIKSAVVSNTFKSAVPDKLLRDQAEKAKEFLRLRDAEAFGESNGENVDDSSAPQKKKGIRDTLSGEGNLTFYEESALEARQGVMEEPDLIEAVNEIWEEMELHAHPDNPDEKVLLEDTYLTFHRRMTQALVPGVEEWDLNSLAQDDWKQDTERLGKKFYRAATKVAKQVATLKHGFSMKIPITPIAEKKETNKPSGAKVGASTEQSAELDMKEVAYLDLAGFRRSILEMADLWTDSIDHNEYIKFIQIVANVVHGMHFNHDASPSKDGVNIMSGLISSAAAPAATPVQTEVEPKASPPIVASLPMLTKDPARTQSSRRLAVGGSDAAGMVSSLLRMPSDTEDMSPLLDHVSASGDSIGAKDDDQVSLNANQLAQPQTNVGTFDNALSQDGVDRNAPLQESCNAHGKALGNASIAPKDLSALHLGDQNPDPDSLFLKTGTLRDQSLDSKDSALSSKSGVTMARSSYGPNTIILSPRHLRLHSSNGFRPGDFFLSTARSPGHKRPTLSRGRALSSASSTIRARRKPTVVQENPWAGTLHSLVQRNYGQPEHQLSTVVSARGPRVIAPSSSLPSFNSVAEVPLSPIQTRSHPRTSDPSFNSATQSMDDPMQSISPQQSMSSHSRPPRSAPVGNLSKRVTPGFMDTSFVGERVRASNGDLLRHDGRPWTSSTIRATTYNTVGLSQPSPLLAAWSHLSPERRRRTSRQIMRSEPSYFGSSSSFDSATSHDRQSSLESAKDFYTTKLSDELIGNETNALGDFDLIESPGPRLRSPPGLPKGGL